MPALPLLGAAVGRSRAASVKRTYAEPALLWAVLVAPPGRAKSPALRFAKGPLSSHTRRWREQYRDKAGYEAHLASPHFQELGFGNAVPRLENRERGFYETWDV